MDTDQCTLERCQMCELEYKRWKKVGDQAIAEEKGALIGRMIDLERGIYTDTNSLENFNEYTKQLDCLNYLFPHIKPVRW